MPLAVLRNKINSNLSYHFIKTSAVHASAAVQSHGSLAAGVLALKVCGPSGLYIGVVAAEVLAQLRGRALDHDAEDEVSEVGVE